MIEPTSDAHSLSILHQACFAEGWSAAGIADLLAQKGVFALEARGAGFVLARIAADEAEIITICVLPGLRRNGLGRRLTLAAANGAAALGALALYLEVAEDNEAARTLYQGLGFAEVGKRKAYYSGNGVSGDALVMRMGLPPEMPDGPLGFRPQNV